MDYSDCNSEIGLRSFVEMFNNPQLLEQIEVVLQGAYSPMKVAHQVDIKVPN